MRAAQYGFDEAQRKPYLELKNVLENGVFNADGTQLAIFIADMYARPSKRGGAWANAYVAQSTLLEQMPVVANHLNIPQPAGGQPTLLTWDEVNTMFHEFGHALHGMFSNVRYPSFAGISVPRALLDKVAAAKRFNQGFLTTEYLSASVLDQRARRPGSAAGAATFAAPG